MSEAKTCSVEPNGCRTETEEKDTRPNILIGRNIHDYDPLRALDILCEFNRFLRDVTARFDENERLQLECEKKSGDLLHYIELHGDMNASEGYKTYKKLAEVRRERRCCKNENELLAPLYTYIQQNAKMVNDISAILGRCRVIRELIEKRIYVPRTDVI